MQGRITNNLLVYTSAISACKNSNGVNLPAAMEIYNDMQRYAQTPHTILQGPSVSPQNLHTCLFSSTSKVASHFQREMRSILGHQLTFSVQFLLHSFSVQSPCGVRLVRLEREGMV